MQVFDFKHERILMRHNSLKTILADDFGLCYDHKLLPQDAQLNIAVMFKCGITATNPRFIPNSDLNVSSHRKALVVDMKVGKFDFTLIAVHLKSGRGAAEQATRDEQAEVIGDFIADFRTANREDVLLMGDFQHDPGAGCEQPPWGGRHDGFPFIVGPSGSLLSHFISGKSEPTRRLRNHTNILDGVYSRFAPRLPDALGDGRRLGEV